MGSANYATLVRRPHRRPFDGEDDRALVRAVRAGDDRAFEELYARYERRISAYVQRMVKDRGRSEDITQEVFLSAVRRLRATAQPIAFKPWLYEIARNACIDHHRRTARAEEIPLEAGIGEHGGSDPTPHRPPRSIPRSRSTSCATPSLGSPPASTGCSSCASWRGAPTGTSASVSS